MRYRSRRELRRYPRIPFVFIRSVSTRPLRKSVARFDDWRRFFFSAMGMRLRVGHAFTSSDGVGAPWVAVVNETMAHVLWPGETPIGKCFIPMDKQHPCYVVVGVAQDFHQLRVIEPASMSFFVPVTQLPVTGVSASNLIIRVSAPAVSRALTALRGGLRQALPASSRSASFRPSDVMARCRNAAVAAGGSSFSPRWAFWR